MWRAPRSTAGWIRSRPTGTARTWREGFRLGWSNRAFRLWLLDLIVWIPFAIVAVVLLALGATPLSCCSLTTLSPAASASLTQSAWNC